MQQEVAHLTHSQKDGGVAVVVVVVVVVVVIAAVVTVVAAAVVAVVVVSWCFCYCSFPAGFLPLLLLLYANACARRAPCGPKLGAPRLPQAKLLMVRLLTAVAVGAASSAATAAGAGAGVTAAAPQASPD